MNDTTFFFGGWEPVLRVVVVGTLAYLALVPLLRVSGKRTLARMNGFDLVLAVAIGAVFGRAITAHDVALVETLVAFVLLVLLQWITAWLQVRSRRFAVLITPPPTLLFFRGRVLEDALRREKMTQPELHAAVREQGLGSMDAVEAIVLESDGKLAVVKAESAGDGSALEGLGQG